MMSEPDIGMENQEIVTMPSRKKQGVEVAVFLFLIVPSMVLSFFVVRQGTIDFVSVATMTMLRDLALVALIIYFIRCNGEPVRNIGWTFKNGWPDILLGIALFFPFYIITGLLESALVEAGFSTPKTSLPSFLEARGVGEFVLASVLVAIVALSEETIFRGYLIHRFQGILYSPLAAVVISSFIFSLGHGYEGSAGVVTVGFMGFIFALVYLWRKSLVAPVVMHFMQDFIGIVLVPVLMKGN